ncbi:MAG: PP2C family protein-serine/threonine phosphatase [Actinocatenispora sp.]
MDSERIEQVAQALRAAPAWAVSDVLADRAKAVFGASDVELLIADYRSGALANVHGGEPLQVDDSPAGRAFASQQTERTKPVVSDGYRLWMPLTTRGDRLGVLGLTLPDPPDERTEAALVQLATATAHEMIAVDSTTDMFRKARRSARLTLAAEMQWDTLPGRGVATPDYTFAGQLEPAYAVCGDTFDWAADPDGLTVAVVNGANEGIAAAMLTSFAVAALRNARRSGDGIAEQAALASDLMYAQFGGDRQLSTLLLRYEPANGTLSVVDAGSPLLVRLRGNDVEVLELDHQLPLGIGQETRYVEQPVPVRSGDRLIVVSDGVHGAVDSQQEAYSIRALGSVLRRTRLQPCGEAIRTVIRDVIHYHGSALDDDAVVVGLDLR